MRTVLFVAPYALETTLQFVRGLAGLDDVRLIGVFQKPPPEQGPFDDTIVVPNVFDVSVLIEAGQLVQRRVGPIHRMMGVLEELQVPLARAREHLDIEGTRVGVTANFRDKGLMKDVLRQAGIPCARHRRVHRAQDAWAFIDEVGFPIVLKPPAGAGCRATYRIDHVHDLMSALNEIQVSPSREVLAEEFLTGPEFHFETITIGGEVKFHSLGRYYPSPLEVMRNDWIQWVVHLPRDIDGPEFAAVKALAPKVNQALGLDTAVTHMEWFRRSDGSIAIGEIALRPPGAQIVPLTGLVHDIDFTRAWARAMVDGAFDGPWERQYSAGAAFLRGMGLGRIKAVQGLSEAQERMGDLVVHAKLPQVGWQKSSSYEGDGVVLIRDRDSERVKQALWEVISTVQVAYA